MSRALLLSALFLVCCAVSGCGTKEVPATEEAMAVKVATAKRELISDRIDLIGIVKPEPDHSARITAAVQGLIQSVVPKVGDWVKPGETVAQLQTSLQLAQRKQTHGALMQAEANFHRAEAGLRPQEIEQARAAVESAKANLSNATASRTRVQKLYDEQVSPGSALDLAVSQEKVAQAQLEAAEAALSMALKGPRKEDKDAAAAQAEQAAGAFDQAKVLVDFASLRSPIAGIVAERYLDPGEQATPSSPILLIVDPHHVMVQAALPVGFSSGIRVGQAVEVAVPDRAGTMHGVVERMGIKLDPLTNTIPIQVAVANPDLQLKFDMTVRTQILKEQHEALVIPSSALIGDADNPSQRFVNVVKDGRTSVIAVGVGVVEGDRTEILSGLSEGQQVISDIGYRLPDGTKVATK